MFALKFQAPITTSFNSLETFSIPWQLSKISISCCARALLAILGLSIFPLYLFV